MSGFGVKNAYGDLRRVLMHRPGEELDLVTEHTLEVPFRSQSGSRAFRVRVRHDGRAFRGARRRNAFLTDVLRNDRDALGYIAHRPNMTYTRDLAAVFRSGAVLMSPHLKGRWGDQAMMGRAFQKLGIPILGAIEPPGFLEGGGVTLLGEDTVVASLCDRANETGTRMLRDLVLGRDAKYFLEVPLPFGHIHIDGIFMALAEDSALVFQESFRVFPCRLYEAGKSEPRHVMFEDFLEERGVRTVLLTRQEREEGHLNVVVTKKSETAVGFESATRIAAEMARHGWRLATFPAGELFLGNGGAHCMTCPMDVG